MSDPLANAFFGRDNDAPARIRQAVVSGTSPVEVTLGGASGMPAATCAGYTPVAADVVLVVQLETDLIIIDKVISGG